MRKESGCIPVTSRKILASVKAASRIPIRIKGSKAQVASTAPENLTLTSNVRPSKLPVRTGRSTSVQPITLCKLVGRRGKVGINRTKIPELGKRVVVKARTSAVGTGAAALCKPITYVKKTALQLLAEHLGTIYEQPGPFVPVQHITNTDKGMDGSA